MPFAYTLILNQNEFNSIYIFHCRIFCLQI